MDSMVTKCQVLIKARYLLIGVACTMLGQTPAYAIDFRVVPSLTFQETYSDNIRLATQGNQEGAWVTEISPGISIRGVNGGRLTANLDYRMQNLFNAGGNGNAQIFHQLQFNSGYILSRNRLNTNIRASYNQQNISNLRGGDNINDLGNRTNVWTAGASVNWTPHFSSFADAVVNVDFDYVGNENVNDDNVDLGNQVLNSMNVSESVSLVSGRDFQRMTWVAAFNNTNNYRQNGDDVQFQNTNATIRGWLDRRFNVFTTLGYANNDFNNLDTSTNGFFWTVGAQWKPNWWFDIEAGYGNNWHISSNLSLSQRTHLSAGYNDRSVGLNTGGAWNANINHITKRSSWNFSYTEDTTTVQQILLQDQAVAVVDANGNPILGDDGQAIFFNQSLPSLTNDVLVRRTANGSVSYTTGKSNFQLGATYEIRDFENVANDQQTVYGVDASWNWQFWRRTGLFLAPSWQRITGDTIDPAFDRGDANQDRYQFLARVTRSIPLQIGRSRVLNASIEYRFVKQDGGLVTVNNPAPGDPTQFDNSYIENRVVFSLFMNF